MCLFVLYCGEIMCSLHLRVLFPLWFINRMYIMSVYNVNTTGTMSVYNVNTTSTMSVYNVNTTSKMSVYNVNTTSTMSVYNVNTTSTMSVYNVNTTSTIFTCVLYCIYSYMFRPHYLAIFRLSVRRCSYIIPLYYIIY
jgi:hypothetical protein